ncbi:MAG: hypothetical protein ACREXY_29485 [Gammaproteobacteria bacterium]
MTWNTRDQGCSPLFEPDFEEDPDGYFDYWQDCIDDTHSDFADPWQPPCRPYRWTDPRNGRCMEKICTAEGPEFRPCPGEPTIPSDYPQVVALQLRTYGFGILVATEEGQRLQSLSRKAVKKIGLVQIISALINKAKLPAPDVTKVPTDFWEKQKRFKVPRPQRGDRVEKSKT